MYQLKSYLKKASLLVFAVLMFVVIPNLQVYSSIGSYQTGSTAIAANKSYQSIKITNANNIEDVVVFRHTAAVPYADYDAPGLSHFARMTRLDYYYDGCLYPSSKDAAKTYTKYDFSGFDN